MISRTRGIFSSNIWKPKNIHSVEYLKYLYNLLNKNQNVSEQNKDLLVEIIRLIAEILIWGDQNDSAVIDFFLEKNILSFFLKFMRHKNGKLICNQLLQTLSIMFENISDNTSIYYLLSNNHINSIICHKFDFSDEEVMAYYISFLKALSMKLNKHTINFFYNEHTEDFALYTEAIKFFNQSESMVRTAVRVITLNVYKVADKPMLKYIRDKTAGPYFRSLVWSIGTQVLDINACLLSESDQVIDSKLQSFIDEHLDNLHYINDILCLNVYQLNDILIDCLLNKLIIPLYIYSLTKYRPFYPESDDRPHISYSLSLYLLSQIFIIIKEPQVVQPLAEIILRGDLSCCSSSSNNSTVTSSNDNINHQDIAVSESSQQQQHDFEMKLESTLVAAGDASARSTSDIIDNVIDRKFETSMDSLTVLLDNIKGKPRPMSRELKSKTLEDYQSPVSSQTECDTDSSSNNKHATTIVARNYKVAQMTNESELANRGHHKSAPVTPRHRLSSVSNPGDIGQNCLTTSMCTSVQLDTNTVTPSTGDATGGSGGNPELSDLSNSQSMNYNDNGSFSLEGKPFLKMIFRCLTLYGEHMNDQLTSSLSFQSDYDVLFALCLLITICQNQGVNSQILASVGLTSKCMTKQLYNRLLLDKFFAIFNCAVKYDSPIRLVTVELICVLIEILVCCPTRSYVSDEHLAYALTLREDSTLLLRNFYKSESIFVDMFEDEYLNLQKRPVNVEFMIMDSHILLKPTSKLLITTDFTKRLPQTDVEHARYAIRLFLLLRQLCDRIKTDDDSDNLSGGEEPNSSSISPRRSVSSTSPTTQLAGINSSYPFNPNIFHIGDKIDLTNRDIVACSIDRNGRIERRFLVTDDQQMILIEPDSKKVGWGVIIFVGFLQHVKINVIREDKRSLFVKVYDHKGAISLKFSGGSTSDSASGGTGGSYIKPLLSAKFTFDDHIRCMVALRRLDKGRDKAQENKLRQIALLLDFPTNVALSIKPSPSNNNNQYRSGYYGPESPRKLLPLQQCESPKHNSNTTVIIDNTISTSSSSNSGNFSNQISGTNSDGNCSDSQISYHDSTDHHKTTNSNRIDNSNSSSNIIKHHEDNNQSL